METTSKYLQFANTSNLPVALFQKLEYVTENRFVLLIFEPTGKIPSKCSIPRSNGHHEWIRVEVLPPGKCPLGMERSFQVHFRSDFVIIFVICFPHQPTLS